MSDSLWPHGLPHTRFSCPLLSLSLCKFMSIESVILSNYLISCQPLLLLSLIFTSIGVCSNESILGHQMAKVLELQLQYQSFNEYSGRISFRVDLVWPPCSLRDSQESPASQLKSTSYSVLSLLYGPIITSIHDYWKNHSFEQRNLCWQSDVSAF